MDTPYVTLREASELSGKSISYLRKLCTKKVLQTNPKGGPKIEILKSSLEDKFDIIEKNEIVLKNEIIELNKKIVEKNKESEQYRLSAIQYKEESVENKRILLESNELNRKLELNKKDLEKDVMKYKGVTLFLCFIIGVIIIFFILGFQTKIMTLS